ncbi:MAG: protein serine/threonine phosphatase [Bacteroidota bacterium]|jgi:serine phosphatase RsbU (regulator of sigma subunit)|nr:protein serine/threonine phosphatase [Bacteroidota bacterium]
MKKLWNFISYVGCDTDLDYQERRRLMLLNRLNLISFLVLVLYMIIEVIMHVYVFIPFIVGMLFLCLITFGLVSLRWYSSAKHFAVLVITMCICFFTLNTGDALSEVLFIPLSAMPLIIFKDKRISIFYLFFLIGVSVIVRKMQSHMVPLLVLSQDQYFFFRAVNLINGIAITYIITYYFKKANESFEDKLLHMNEVVTEKNKEITDSINYAKHIQSAILPSLRTFKDHLPGSFVLYKPKDIVAGDFYWMFAQDDHIYFAAADCTGHGVPGAMVSVICSNALNRSVKEFGITQPGEILDKARELVIETFIHSEDIREREQHEVKDGMDISLCCLNIKTRELLWSGANNPLWIIRHSELLEFKPDKQPIGLSDNPKPFNTKSIQLEPADNIFIFTDGYADQFGGEKGKKFKYSKFKELLVRISRHTPETQLNTIEKELDEWKHGLEQVDDILVVGVRI